MTLQTVNLCSLNVGMSNSLGGLSALISSQNMDVIFLQEVRMSGSQIEHLLPGFNAVANIDKDNLTRPGTAIAWRSNLPVKDIVSFSPCRIQIATLGTYRLINIYAPSGSNRKQERASFFSQDLFTALQLNPSLSLIMGGDYNCLLQAIDVENGFGFSQKRCPALDDLVKVNNLLDSFRVCHPDSIEFTFFRAGCAPSRLDRIYVSSSLKDSVCDVTHFASLADHCGVKIRLNVDLDTLLTPRSKDYSYWKLNTAILLDENFLPCFKILWSELTEDIVSFPDVAEWWDMLAKPKIKDFCISFSVNRKQQRTETKHYLLSYLKVALVSQDWEEVARVREKLNQMLLEDAVGFVVRSRFHQNAEEEKASLFHAGREFKNSKNKITSLTSHGQILTDPLLIENEVKTFFGALFNGQHDTQLQDTGIPFQPDNTNLNDMLADLVAMEKRDSEKLDVDISIEELELVISECVNNKSPGLDGLCYEFYRSTWPIIKDTFLLVLQCQLDRNRIVSSNTIGATRLISKVDGVPRVDELRPITLLNCDYKILAKVLVRRMKPIMPYVIKSGQLCSVGKKNILFGVYNLLSSILYAQQKNMAACILSLDFFKAYDRVFIGFLVRVMEKMGFSDKFCSWISMLHHDAKTRFILSKLTQAVNVSFSIRQGDPLAMLLYILYIEPLLIYIEKRVSGLQALVPLRSGIPAANSVESYCDDVNIITSKVQDLEIIDMAVKKFETLSGAILSRNHKCKILGIGRWSKRVIWPLDYVITVKEIKIFGIYILNSYKSILKRNWDYRVRKFEQAVMSWSSRSIYLLSQRVQVLKTFALSRVYYVASILPMTKSVGNRFEKLIGKFIWTYSGKLLRVALNELKLPSKRGGMGLTCIHLMSKSLFLTQFLRLLKNSTEKSIRFADFWVGEVLKDLDSDFDQCVHPATFPAYFQSIAFSMADALSLDIISTNNWKQITNRMVYNCNLRFLPDPKVEIDLGYSLSDVWKLLWDPSLTSEMREILYLLIHRKLPVKERLFRINLAIDPYCEFCADELQSYQICDFEHFFCSCVRVSSVWPHIRNIILNCLQAQVSDQALITLCIPKSSYDKEITWIVGAYIDYVWRILHVEGTSVIDKKKLFGYLKFKYRAGQLGARVQLFCPGNIFD